MYYISCKNYAIGSGKVDSYDDDNDGNGYSLEEALKRQKELNDVKEFDGELTGTIATVFHFNGEEL